ncbi:MAG: prolipoprotein diacylglyceryl transferase [Bdellovibrionaceae bacterium]|nr:prolipoprotein diacylglyceryl transferase [Pseudobdellovibrionaceae bacterium]
MVHDLHPVIFYIHGDLGVRWYGLSYLLGFLLAYGVAYWLVKRQRSQVTTEMLGDLTTYCAIGTLAGGRLGYCLFYSPDLFLKFKAEFPFWGVLAVNEGGMASHGGMIGIAVACVLFARKYGISRLYLFDLVTVSGSIGVIFGRIANFINGELVGREAPADFPLAVRFPTDIYLWPAQEPGRLEGLAAVVEKIPGQSRDHYLDLVAQQAANPGARSQLNQVLMTIVDQIQHGNAAAKEAIAPLLTYRHPSQLYAALGEGVVVFLVLMAVWYKPRKAGIVGASFLIIYGIVRIVQEQFRMPDAHLGFQALGMTRGQWLSVGMTLIGVGLAIFWSRSGSLVIPGWGRVSSIKINRRSKSE